MVGGLRGEVKLVINKWGFECGIVVENDEMMLDDMVCEECCIKGEVGGEGMCLVERIVKDGKFDNDLEYLDENVEKLVKRVYKIDLSLKNVVVMEYKKLNWILDSCLLCYYEEKNLLGNLLVVLVVFLGMRMYFILVLVLELMGVEGGVVIVFLLY